VDLAIGDRRRPPDPGPVDDPLDKHQAEMRTRVRELRLQQIPHGERQELDVVDGEDHRPRSRPVHEEPERRNALGGHRRRSDRLGQERLDERTGYGDLRGEVARSAVPVGHATVRGALLEVGPRTSRTLAEEARRIARGFTTRAEHPLDLLEQVRGLQLPRRHIDVDADCALVQRREPDHQLPDEERLSDA
jgi:hypothetical protein